MQPYTLKFWLVFVCNMVLLEDYDEDILYDSLYVCETIKDSCGGEGNCPSYNQPS